MRLSFSGEASVAAGASAHAVAAHASAAPDSAAGTARSKETFSACFASSNSCTSVSYAFRFFVAVVLTAVVRARFNATSTFPVAAAVASDALDQRAPPLSAAAVASALIASIHATLFNAARMSSLFYRLFPTFLPCFCHILQVITADEHANRRHPMPRGTPAQYQKRSCNLCFLRPPDGPPHAHTQPARMP